jgi:putative ATP-binding cassette transporter
LLKNLITTYLVGRYDLRDLIKLFQRDSDLLTAHFLRLVIFSGLANAAVLAVINMAVQSQSKGTSGNFRALIMFCLAIGIYALSQRRLMFDSCDRAERLIDKLRLRLLDAIRTTEYQDIETIGRGEIFGSLSRETQTLSQTMPMLVIGAQSAVLLVASMTYMFFLSTTAFILLIVFTAAGVAFHFSRSKSTAVQLEKAAKNEDLLVEAFSDVMDGFREIKLNAARSMQISQEIMRTSADVVLSRRFLHDLNSRDFVLSQITFFILTGLMVFVAPALVGVKSSTIAMTTTATLFMLGPVGALVGAFHVISTANAAAKRIMELEIKLLVCAPPINDQCNLNQFQDFSEITLEALSYRYPAVDSDGFCVGPNDLTIRRGDCVFMTGGNGSGKTTFLNLLLTLVPATEGKITVDGKTIINGNVMAYRNMFSAIFSDDHLFRKLYGVENIDPDNVHRLLAEMELDGKVTLVGDQYSTVDLSGGQRKRLALVSAQLEKKPILILDEWAADQDPVFRKKFYREVLPGLKERGYTIIAITHDDRYFDVADARYHMEDGHLRRLD